ncbi:MAG: PKD domain-containing protein [Verrucomicrobiota bacterium]
MKGIVLSVMLLLGGGCFAQPVVVDSDTTNIFAVGVAATNYSWSLDGVAVGGNSNSYSYTPPVYDVGTHYLLVNQTLPGLVNSNTTWAVRVRIPLPVSGANYFVATNGADTNAGTFGAPFLTLEKARNVIRTLPRPLPPGGVTVWLRGGTYYRTNTLMLTNLNDSGSALAPVVYRGYSNETAVISGGKPLAATSFVPLDPSQTNRVAPGVNPANIWEADVTSAALTHATNFPAHFGQWTTFNVYSQGNDGGLCELFYNGQRQFLSRYPNHSLVNDDLFTTNLMMDGVAVGRLNPGTTLSWTGDSTNFLSYPGTYTNSAGAPVAVGGAFYCKSNDVSRFTRWQSALTNGGLWLQGYWRVPWQIDGLKIKGFDVTNRAVLLETNATPGGGIASKYARPVGYKTEPYWVLNLLEEMDQPGEWAVDFNRKKIYFYAPGPIADGSVVVSDFGSPFVQISGGSNLVFQSLNFEAGLAQGILITNGVRNLVLGCSFRNMGNMSVDINGGGTNGVVSCHLQDLAGGGILMRGGTESTNAALRVPTRNFVVNNVVTNFSRAVRVYAAAVDAGFFGPISGGGGGHYACVGARVAHNDISVSPHCAVLHASWDNVFEYNEIANFQQVSDDLGAFYSYDYSYQHGNQTFRYNFIHDSPYGNGIDFDQDSLAMHIYGNVMNLNTYASESQGYGVVYHDYNQDIPGREQYADNYNNLFANTHVGAKYVSPLPAVIAGNASIFCTTPFTWELVTLGVSTNTLSTSSQAVMQSAPNTNYLSDPGFLSLANNDLRLNPASRIYTDLPTFRQIPVELIGLYNDEFRTNAGGYPPLIVTSNATAVTGTNAVFNGWLYFPQFESNTTVTVYYGPTDGGSNAGAWQSSANIGVLPAGPLSASLAGLPGGTNYFRFYAANAFGSSWSPATYSTVTPATVITSVTPGQTVLSNSVVNLSGQIIATGPLYPAIGETISVTINGSTQLGAVTNSTGYFWVAFNTAGLPAAGSPYVVNYYYGGNGSISSATNASTTLTIAPPSVLWSGAAGTNFETGGLGGNWSDNPAPVNDLIFSTAVFGNPPTANLPSLTTNRSVKGLSFSATAGGWKLASGSANCFLSVGAGGITTSGQTSGTNLISASLAVATNQTWQAGTGGNLLFTGSITNVAPSNACSVTFNSGSVNGNVILSPSAGNNIVLVGFNTNNSLLQVKAGGVLQLGGDGVSTPFTVSSNRIINISSNANSYSALGLNSPAKVQVNSGTWLFSDLGKNGGDRLTGTLEINNGVVCFGGARYLGEGTINVNGGIFRVGVDLVSEIINGARFSLGLVYSYKTNVAVMNVGGTGFVDLSQSNGGNSIGSGISSLLNQSGGIMQNGISTSPSGGTSANSFTIGGSGTGTTNNLTAFTLVGGTFISAGIVSAAAVAGPGSMNNFNFMGGVLAVQSFNATNLGSSPTATTYANQTNVSLALGTLANYGGALAPGNLGVPGKTVILGSYAVSNSAAVLAIDIGGTNQANAFQNGPTNYDFVAIAGSAALGGGLNINLINGFVPAATNSFIILTNGGTLSGSFTNLVAGRVAVTNLPGGSFEVAMNGAKVVLTNFGILQANFSASATNGATPLSVTFTDLSTGNITNRYWSFGDGAATNTMATSLAHTFASAGTNLVTLIVSDGLWTSTNSLALVAVGASGPPSIGGISWSGTQVIVAGTNGTAGERFYVLATTNLFLPMTNWDIIATNQSGPGGSINFTSPLSPGLPQLFYRLRRP